MKSLLFASGCLVLLLLAKDVNGQCESKLKCSACKADAQCTYCDAVQGTTSLGIGMCIKKGDCDAAKLKGLNIMTKLAGATDITYKKIENAGTENCPTPDNDTVFEDKADCKACIAIGKWCHLKSATGFATGSICLKTKDACTTLGTKLKATGTGLDACKDPVSCTTQLSCEDCKKDNCLWCGLTVFDKTATPQTYSGKNLGKCMTMPTEPKTPEEACKEFKLDATKVYNYKEKTHEYETKAMPAEQKFGLTCTNNLVDIIPDTPKCEDCIKNDKNNYCALKTEASTPIEGGICMKGDEAKSKATCESLKVDAKKDELLATSAKFGKKCGSCLASLSFGVAIAAVISSFVSYF